MKLLPITLLALLLSGCSTHYLYSGKIQAIDSDNKSREVLVYWTKTDHFLRKNKNAGNAIKLKTQCSTVTLNYIENEEGIQFLNSDQKHLSIDPAQPSGFCGEIQGHKKVNQISEGPMNLTLLCQAKRSALSLPAGSRYLKAQSQPYQFNISRRKIDAGYAPNVAKCDE